ncbi:MAG: radical SAM family heme chaperone HemW [Akkermansiaceae bacterium]|jgi:oxygen-independent coproporphyrinogen III oxidase|nr:radical SAM family heme chaperone HemW [Akkermansiaceae bacterium]MDG1853590.1 radical SAM family heme chaperone HemW [Verrucomicrobiales bacterium]
MVKHLYIHVPFCHRICPYCSFYKHTFGNINQSELVDSVLNEISIRAQNLELNIETIYLGGGTPTALSPKNLETLLTGINKKINPSGLVEWVIEANPSTFDLNKAKLIKNNNITRVSLGIQSWNLSTLKTLGRDHDPDEAEKSFEILRSCKFKSLNIDLMFSVPGQSLKSWTSDLHRTIKIKPDHISAYNLNYEEDTEYFEKLKSGDFNENPEKDGKLFKSAMEVLRGSGYEHYEISNYALPGHQSEHNKAYWSGADYLGIGPGAFSTVHGKRWRNVADTAKYIESLKLKKIDKIETEREIINDSSFRTERIALELRTSRGISFDTLGKTKNRIDDLETEGLISIHENRISLTDKGKMVADSVAAHLL